MYLSKKRIKALETAIEALEFGTSNNIQAEESSFAIDIILDMLQKAGKRLTQPVPEEEQWKD